MIVYYEQYRSICACTLECTPQNLIVEQQLCTYMKNSYIMLKTDLE